MNRREALAALASTAVLPLTSACRSEPGVSRPVTTIDADARALLDELGENLVRLLPESGTSLGIDTGARASLRARLTDRSAAGQQRIASQLKGDLERANAVDTSTLSHATRTSVEVVRSAYATALQGFALPYGDVAVGGWRNTPYVVIQNVGAYLDVPRFLDSDHRIENAADAEAYLARLQAYVKALDGERGRIEAARATGLVPPAFLIDKALAQMSLSAKNAREGGALVESIERRTKNIPGNWTERARMIAAQEIAPALERQIAELQAQRSVATGDAGMWARPKGEDYYRWALKASTTTGMTPDEVHELGRSELDRLHAQMDGILKRIGYSQRSVGERMQALAKDPKYRFSEGDKGRAEILAFIQNRLDWIRSQMPRAFNTLVHPNMEVKRLPPEEEPGLRPPTAARDQSTARSPAGSGSISVTPTSTASTALPTSPFMNRFPATSGKASTPTKCRSSDSCSPSTPTRKGGACMPSSSLTSSAPMKAILSAGSGTCSQSPSARAGWWSTPGFTSSAGRALRECSSSST